MRIDPTTLRLFVAVIDSGTIAAASEREHIAPSAVSKRLSDLEETLRTSLLQRSNRGIEPTSAGIALVSMARSVLNDLDNIHLQLQDYTLGARGLIRIFANISAITEFMPASLRSFMAKYPDVKIQLAEKISSAVVRGVAANAADVGLFARANSEAEGLLTLPYRRDELVIAVPVDHPLASLKSVTIGKTFDYDYVGLHTGSFINQELLKAARILGLPFRCRMQVTSFDALTLMVEAGMGIALMPRLIGERFSKLSGIQILTLDEPWAFRDLCICIRSFESLPISVRLFVEHLQSEAV